MEHLIAYARAEGLRELFGTVLAENTTMLQMCRELGFRILPDPDDDWGLRHVSLVLGDAPSWRATEAARGVLAADKRRQLSPP